MSYEGLEEYLCKNGHYWAEDCYSTADKPACSRCGLPAAWKHAVDQTNGVIEMGNGEPDPTTCQWPLEVDHYEEQTIRVPIYKVPKAGRS